MKAALLTVAACALFCSVCTAPQNEVETQVEEKKAKEQHSFHFYDKAAEEAARDLLSHVLQSEDTVEIQGLSSWFLNKAKLIMKKCGNSVMQAAKKCFMVKMYEREAIEQDMELISDLMRSIMQSKEDMTSVETQSIWNWIKNKAQELISKCGNPVLNNAKQCVMNAMFQPTAQGGDDKAEEQHSFHFYDQAAKKEGDEKADDQHSFHFYDQAAKKEGDIKADEQHSFHFYDRVTKQDEDVARDLIRKILQSQD